MLPIGGSLITTLALMLMTIAACENDDVQPVFNPPLPGELSFSIGDDLNLVVGQEVALRPSSQFFRAPSGTSWSWKILSKPDNSQSTLNTPDNIITVFQPDRPGEYQLELTGTGGQLTLSDTLALNAFTVTHLNGSYQVMFDADGTISDLNVYLGKLYAVGDFTRIGGVDAYGIASYDGSAWSPLGLGFKRDFQNHDWGGIDEMIEYNGDLYVAGYFSGPEELVSPAVSRWNGTSWMAVPGLNLLRFEGGFGESVFRNYGDALEVYQGELFIGGHFQAPSLGGSSEYWVVKWDGNRLTGIPTTFATVDDLKVYKQHLYAVSSFKNIIAFYDGSDWSERDVALDAELEIYDLNLASYQDKLFISFQSAGPSSYGGLEIRTWDGTKFTRYGKPFSSKFGNVIFSLEIVNDVLHLGGAFSEEVVTSSTKGLLTWNGQEWGVVPNGHSATIKSMQQFQDKLFIAGSFDDSSTSQIVIWQPN